MNTPTVDIQEITRRIVATAHPHRVILFGSRGRERGRSESDWDILVIADSKRPRHERAAPLYGALSDLREPMDILVYDEEFWPDLNTAREAVRQAVEIREFLLTRLPDSFRCSRP